MANVIPPPLCPSLPVVGSVMRFPVHRIYCVGRNYVDHAVEMGHDPDREDPFFFQKNPDNVVADGGEFPYPSKTGDVHHEIELVAALGTGGIDVAMDQALELVYGYAVGLDMTRRDLQGQMKATGRPWEIGKALESSAPCSAVYPVTEIGHPNSGRIRLEKNGTSCQMGDLAQMIWKVPEIIAYLSEFFVLSPGDLIFTGTPAGVGPVLRGDVLHGVIEGVGELHLVVT